MIKKIPLWLMIFVFVLQIIVPVSMIANEKVSEHKTLESTEEYKIKIDIRDVSKGTVTFYPSKDYFREYTPYCVVKPDEEMGFVKLVPSNEKSADRKFVNLTGNGYYEFPVTTFELSKEYNYFNFYDFDTQEEIPAYMTAKIYNGNIVVTAIFVENTPIEQWLETHNAYFL